MHYNESIGELWTNIMFNAKKIEEIAKQVTDAIPPKFKDIANDIEEKTKVVLQRLTWFLVKSLMCRHKYY